MNKVILIGRLCADPEIRCSQGAQPLTIARYRLAVDRRYNREQQTADFIPCVAFGSNAEFAEKYLHQGTKMAVTGRIQTGSYTNRDGQKVYTTDVIVEEQEFCESKSSSGTAQQPSGSRPSPENASSGWLNIPDGVEDEELPFN